jgi:hypothetical protein
MQYDMPMTQGRELPQFNLRQIDLPDLSTWEVGDQKYIVMKVEMVEKRSGNAYGMQDDVDKASLEGTFKMLSIRTLGHEAVDAKSLESAEFNKVIAKIKSGEM